MKIPTEVVVAMLSVVGTLIVSTMNYLDNRQNAKKEDLIYLINKVQLDNCKNFLVQAISKVEKGEELSPVEKERFWENYDQYVRLGGNSYIHSSTEKLSKQGKL